MYIYIINTFYFASNSDISQKYCCDICYTDVNTLFHTSSSNAPIIGNYFSKNGRFANFIIVNNYFKGVHISER